MSIALLRQIRLVALYQSALGLLNSKRISQTDPHRVLVHLNRVPSCRDQISPAILIGPADTAERAGRHMESIT